MRVDAVFLRQITLAWKIISRVPVGIVIIHFAGGWLQKSENKAYERCLSASVRTCDCDEIASVDCEIDVRQYVASVA